MRIRDFCALALLGLSACLLSCSKAPTPIAGKPSPKTLEARQPSPPKRLVLNQALFDGKLPMYTNFMDVNGDSKLDLIVGSKGHEFFDEQPNFRISRQYGKDKSYVSILKNQSIIGEFRFGAVFQPNHHGHEGQIPFG